MRPRRTTTRRTDSYEVRLEAAEQAFLRAVPDHVNNGEEAQYRTPTPAGPLSYIANYSKGLRHNLIGEVIPAAYRSLLRALDREDPDQFELIQLGMPAGGRKLTNPQAGLAFDLEGPDAQAVTIPPAPRIDGPENSAEMGELYWMALLRDVDFRDYGTGANTDAGPNDTAGAAASLTNDFTMFTGPRDAAGAVTPQTLFRGFAPGDLAGPYVSQFMLIGSADTGVTPQDGYISYGTLRIDQRQKTARRGVDYLTRFEAPSFSPFPPPQNWRSAQEGADYRDFDVFDPTRRFIRNLRDLATYVHFDALYEAYLNACLILLGKNVLGMNAPFDPGNPYVDSRTQDGFGTFGGPHILSLVTEVATRALKAVWFQKWGVHRRLRPEEFGGRIHVHLRGLPPYFFPFRPAIPPGRYPMIDPEILNTAPGSVLARIRTYNVTNFGNDTYLLPQAFPEGCPTHPAYGAGHATVAGACVTILKAWFDESFVLPQVLQPDAAGTALVPVASPPLTVGGELNKLAANVAIARNGAGVHWRTDYTESVRLGEEIAIGILREQRLTYNEDHHFTLTRFDGTAITI